MYCALKRPLSSSAEGRRSQRTGWCVVVGAVSPGACERSSRAEAGLSERVPSADAARCPPEGRIWPLRVLAEAVVGDRGHGGVVYRSLCHPMRVVVCDGHGGPPLGASIPIGTRHVVGKRNASLPVGVGFSYGGRRFRPGHAANAAASSRWGWGAPIGGPIPTGTCHIW